MNFVNANIRGINYNFRHFGKGAVQAYPEQMLMRVLLTSLPYPESIYVHILILMRCKHPGRYSTRFKLQHSKHLQTFADKIHRSRADVLLWVQTVEKIKE